jgi:hypothetical protein
VENDGVLRVEVMLEGLALQNCLELAQECKCLGSVVHLVKARVDKVLKGPLQLADVDVELEKVAVKVVPARRVQGSGFRVWV